MIGEEGDGKLIAGGNEGKVADDAMVNLGVRRRGVVSVVERNYGEKIVVQKSNRESES